MESFREKQGGMSNQSEQSIWMDLDQWAVSETDGQDLGRAVTREAQLDNRSDLS